MNLSRRNLLTGGAGLALVAASGVVPGLPLQRPSVGVPPPGPRSRALLRRLREAFAHSNQTGLYGIALDDGYGPYIRDVDGNIYLDCLSAGSVNILGYGHVGIAQRLETVASSMQNGGFAYSPDAYSVELAELLNQITPGDFPKKTLLGLSGSSSNDGALEATRRYTRRHGILHFKDAYHGSTGLSQPASQYGNLNKGLYPSNDPLFKALPFPIDETVAAKVLQQVDELGKSGDYGGMIVEIIQGDAGVLVAPEPFFRELKALLERHQMLLIADEIQSGMGRTGRFWASEHYDIAPDILVTGKALGAGFAPISAAVGRAEVMDALDPAQHIFTFTGHRLGAVAAIAAIYDVGGNGLIENASLRGTALQQGLQRSVSDYPKVVKAVRGKGLMLGVEIDLSRNPLDGMAFATRCVELGVYVGFFGVDHQVIRLEPPLTIGGGEVAFITNILSAVAEEMANGKIPPRVYENVKRYSAGI